MADKPISLGMAAFADEMNRLAEEGYQASPQALMVFAGMVDEFTADVRKLETAAGIKRAPQTGNVVAFAPRCDTPQSSGGDAA